MTRITRNIRKALALAVTLGCLSLSSQAMAAETSFGGGAAVGEGRSMAYNLNVKQAYEPWVSGEAGELRPTAELAGFLWFDNGEHVWGASLAPGVRYTMFTNSGIQPFLGASVGGALISDEKLDKRDLGSHALFRTQGALGVQFGESLNHSVQGEYTYYSTWGIVDDEDGYSTVGLSYGYAF